MRQKNVFVNILTLFLILYVLNFNVMAQSTFIRNISWKYDKSIKVTPENEKYFLWFEGAISSEVSGLPLYFERILLPKGTIKTEVSIYNTVYQDVEQYAKIKITTGLLLENTAIIRSNIMYDRKEPYAGITINPFRINPETGNPEKLISFSFEIKTTDAENSKQKSWSFSSHSVLSSGIWYKLGVTASGIYKLTYNDLQQMGIPVDQILPQNISLYGQGGKMLPEANSDFRYDDLQENAIFVSGEGDGHFDTEDYILFYGDGSVQWIYDSVNSRFLHRTNKYSGSAYYFLNVGGSIAGKRIMNQPSLSQAPDYYANKYQAVLFHEKDSVNLIKSGREWYGEVFDMQTSYNYSFQLPNIAAGSQIRLKYSVLSRSFATSYYYIYINGTKVHTKLMNPVDPLYTSIYANNQEDTIVAPANSILNLMFEYNKNNSSSATGWLNYFTVNYTANLSYLGGQMPFRNGWSIGKGVTEFTLGNSSGVTVWNVTDPLDVKVVSGTYVSNDFIFKLRTDSLLEFIAFNGSNYAVPQVLGRVDNQDLHGIGPVDMVILTHPDFEVQANRLADHHRSFDNLNVVVLTPNLVYNEFSSGKQDPTAIRSLMKMFYDRAGLDPDLMPRYLLLFGDGSYDCLDRIAGNTNYIITWQTSSSLAPTNSYLTDDYFGFLDDSESGGYGGNLDVAIGRLPVKSLEEATFAVDKILRYSSTSDLVTETGGCSGITSNISNFAEWKNVLCFVADDADKPGENFLLESESIAKKIDTAFPCYNIDKIYFDAYIQESTPGGQRYPDVTDAILNRIEKGTFIINYIGHGGETGWAAEAVLGVSDINGMSNKYNMPLFVTATCEFSRFDDPDRTSAGEFVFLNPNGGGIALFTTTRLAFSGSNSELNSRFYNFVFDKSSGEYPALGDVVRNSKNSYGCASVIANFCLLGDPAMKLSYPKHKVITTKINNQIVVTDMDTIKALSKVVISGEIQDESGNKLTSFNGLLYPMVLDKPMKVTSRGNDEGHPETFYLQKNIVYKGKASVNSGTFSFSFLVPKDIAYQFGYGKFSYYAQNGNSDASGYYRKFIIGGTENNAITDQEGPGIDLYMNDEKFISGGITDPDPVLFAKVSDSSGMNTVGSGIGHDIDAVLDGNTDKTYVLNDYYEADLNTYQSGVVRYPFKELADGSHTLSLKVWDIFNNSSERSIDFVVAENANLALDHVLNYPNPFTTYTEFWFEHNRPCCGLDVQVQIFTISGKLVKSINAWVQTNGYRADPIPWDGLDDYGDPIGKGVYIYKLKVKDNQGGYAETIEKLVILR